MPLNAATLSRMTLLHDTHDLWPSFLDAAIGQTVPPLRGLRFNQTTLALDAALAGQGIALASRFLVQRDLTAGRLVQPIRSVLEGEQDFFLLVPRQEASEAAMQVCNWLIEVAQEE